MAAEVELVKELYLLGKGYLDPMYEKGGWSRQEEAMIVNFLARYRKIGNPLRDELSTFFLFQFNRWHDLKTHRPITLGWIIGPKAIQRWLERSPGWTKSISKRLVARYGVVFLTEADREVPRLMVGLSDREEREKGRCYNTDLALTNCRTFTTLYHPESEWCEGCNYAKQCKKLQRKLYPKLHAARLETQRLPEA